jgi:hypothetical protein
MTTLGKLETSDSSIFGEELNQSSTYRILGLVNGLLLGLALALGAWGISGYTQSSLPVRMPVTGFVLAAVLVLTFAGTAGWLTARLSKGWFTDVRLFPVLVATPAGNEQGTQRPGLAGGRTIRGLRAA